VVLLYMFISCISLLHRMMRRATNIELAQELAVLLALLLALIVEQVKVSAARYASSMLIYAFVFINIYYYRIRYNVIESYPKS